MDIGSGNQKATQEILERWKQLEAMEMDEAVQEMRFHRGKEFTKLVFALPRGADRSAILASLRSIADVKVLAGQAPPNYNEEELSEWLETLTTQ